MTDWRQRSNEMHRRAQKAEGKLARIAAEHEIAFNYAMKEVHRKGGGWSSGRYLYASFMMNFMKRIFSN